MTPATIERREHAVHEDRWLDQRVDAWTRAGLITEEQASAVRAYESIGHPAAPSVRLGPIAEAAAFVGTILAMIGGGVGFGPQWGDMALWLRLTIAALIAVVGFVAGRWLMRLGEPGTVRLGGFLWVLGTAGVVLAAATLMNEVRPDSPWMAIAIGAPALVIGASLWRNRDRPFQLVTAGVGLSTTAGGIMALADLDPWHAAPVTWLVGAAVWLLTTRTVLRPLPVVRGMASIALVSGAFMMCDLSVRWGAGFALLTASAVIVLALRTAENLALAVGTVGAFMAVQTLVQTTFHGPAGGAILALAGLAMVLLVVVRARGGRRSHAT
jgi:hypothetical protein